MAKVELTKDGRARLINNETGKEEHIDASAAPAYLKSGKYSIAATLADQHAPERVIDTPIKAPVAGAPAPPNPEDNPYDFGEMAQIGIKRFVDGATTLSSFVESEKQRQLADKYPNLAMASEAAGMLATAPLLGWLGAGRFAGKLAGKLGGTALKAYQAYDKVSDVSKMATKAGKAGAYAAQAAASGIRPTLNETGRQVSNDGYFDGSQFLSNLSMNTMAGAISKPAGDLIAASPRFARWAGRKIADTVRVPLQKADEIMAARAAGKFVPKVMTDADKALVETAEGALAKAKELKSEAFDQFKVDAAAAALPAKRIAVLNDKIAKAERLGKVFKMTKKQAAELEADKALAKASNERLTVWNSAVDQHSKEIDQLEKFIGETKFETPESVKGAGYNIAQEMTRTALGGAAGSAAYQLGNKYGGPTTGAIAGGTVGLAARALANPKAMEGVFRYLMDPAKGVLGKKIASGAGKLGEWVLEGSGKYAGKYGSLAETDVSPKNYYAPSQYWGDRDGIQLDKESIEDQIPQLERKLEFVRGTDAEQSTLQQLEFSKELLNKINAGSMDDIMHVRKVSEDLSLAFNPDSAVQSLASGRLTPDQVTFLRKFSPGVAQQLESGARDMQNTFTLAGEEPTGNQAAVISMLTGQPVGKGVGNPVHARVYQGIISSGMGGGRGKQAAPGGRGGYVSVKNRPGVDDAAKLQGK